MRPHGKPLRLGVFAAATATAVAVWLAPISAGADDARIEDGNDTRGRFDIRAVEAVHTRDGLIYTVTTFESFAAIDPRVAVVAVGFDTDGDGSRFERVLFFYTTRTSTGVTWRGAITNGNGSRILSRPQVRHPSPTSVEARFGTEKITRKSGYRWFAFTVTDERGDCCTDTAPDRRWVLHDLVPPTVDDLDLGVGEGQTVASTDVTATFTVVDAGGSGVSRWDLKTRVNGTDDWTTVATGSSGGAQNVSFTGVPGTAYDVCVRAEDRSGHVTDDAFSFVEIPFDDTDPMFSFDGSWSVETSHADDFMGTRHVGTEGAELVITVPANVDIHPVLPAGLDGFAWADIGPDVFTGVDMAYASTPRTIHPRIAGPYPQPTTVHLRVDLGTFAIDGLMGPRFVPPPPSEARCP